MNKNCCYIFAAGDFNGNIDISDGDFIIAADAGYLHLKKLEITPDLLVGDFDSLEAIPKCKEILRFKPEKDLTDTTIAVSQAVKRGYRKIIICGALGGKRPEHSLANLQTAAELAKNGMEIYLTDGVNVIRVIHNSKIEFDENNSGYISVFSLTEKSRGVTLSGLKYPLNDAILSYCVPLGVSNEFIKGTKSTVSVSDGTLAVFWKTNG